MATIQSRRVVTIHILAVCTIFKLPASENNGDCGCIDNIISNVLNLARVVIEDTVVGFYEIRAIEAGTAGEFLSITIF